MSKAPKADGFSMSEAFAAATEKPAAAPKAAKVKTKVTYIAPSRQKRQQLGLWIPDNVHKALRVTAAQEGMTLQQIGEEALHDWLVKKGQTKLLKD